MDFLSRLLARVRGSGPEPAPGPVHEPSADPVTPAAQADPSLDYGAAPEASIEVAWHRVTTESGQSEYRGEVDGAVVATIVKRKNGANGSDTWQWRLDAPGEPRLGESPRLKDAKPAAALALARGHR